MALPKEPRQKMINIMYLVLTAILALNVSAEILNAFKVVDSSLQKSNTSIEESNKTLFQSLQDKMKKPESAEKATLWYGHAKQAEDLSMVLYKKIEQFKDSLKIASGLDIANGVNTYKEDDLEAATRLFIVKEKGPELLKDLTKLKADLLAIAPEIGKEFSTKLPIDLSIPPSTTGSNNSWEYNYFHMTPTVAAVTILSKFENDIKNAENQVITFCHNQIGKVVVEYTGSVGLVSQSSDYVMPGQKIKVKAGVGIFSEKSGVNISIGGQSFPNAKGFAQTEMDAGGVGKHTIPVTITYPDQQGKLVTVLDKVEYTVGVPGGAAIMLDKMNVFYIGVDNPITISSGSGWDRTTVNMTGGTISGSGSNRIVKVTNIGAAKLTVTADGRTTPFDFRVKRIPDPIFKVGPSSGGGIQAAVFKSQQFCRAELENFDFDARFQVVSATVYFTGAGFPVTQQAELKGNNLGALAQLQLCKPGSSVIFDNLKVQGPDGVVRGITAPGFLLK